MEPLGKGVLAHLVTLYPGHPHCPRQDTLLNTELKVSVFQPGTQSQQNGAFSSIKTTLAEMIMHFPVYLRLCGSSLFEVSTFLPFYQKKAGDRCPVLNSVIFCIELFSKIITLQNK